MIKPLLVVSALAFVLVGALGAARCMPPVGAPLRLAAAIDGQNLGDDLLSVAVDQLPDVPDAALLELRPSPLTGKLAEGMDVEVRVRGGPDHGTALFKGEVVGVEPVFENGEQRVVVRAFNKLHRLTRGKKSRTFENMSDKDIVHRIAEENGLEAVTSGFEIEEVREFVFQNNQTDLEFLLARAAAVGAQAWSNGHDIHFGSRAAAPAVDASCQPLDTQLEAFLVRLNGANQVKKVTVRGWDPKKKEEIVGEAPRRVTDLSEPPHDPATLGGVELDLGRVELLASESEAHAAGAGALDAMTQNEVVAEIRSRGDIRLAPRAPINLNTPAGRFNGKYHVVGCSHRYRTSGNDGYHTVSRLGSGRDRGFFVLPEVGDEVLVAFEHGDIRQPIVVGSVWNDTDKPPREQSPCVSGGSDGR